MPSKPGVYAILSGRGKLFYIGRSKDLSGRWASKKHHRYPQAVMLRNPQLAWFVYKGDLATLESQLIKRYRPCWNGSAVPQISRRGYRQASPCDWLLNPAIGALIIGLSIVGLGVLLSPG